LCLEILEVLDCQLLPAGLFDLAFQQLLERLSTLDNHEGLVSLMRPEFQQHLGVHVILVVL